MHTSQPTHPTQRKTWKNKNLKPCTYLHHQRQTLATLSSPLYSRYWLLLVCHGGGKTSARVISSAFKGFIFSSTIVAVIEFWMRPIPWHQYNTLFCYCTKNIYFQPFCRLLLQTGRFRRGKRRKGKRGKEEPNESRRKVRKE